MNVSEQIGKVTENSAFENLCVNAIRALAIDGVQKANSGHPGAPLGMAPMAYVLWTRHMRFNPTDPQWANRDRFVLSAGHASMLLYSLLYLNGFDLPLEQLKTFRQWGSLTPGHPEYGLTAGVETTTGPLGQGLATAVGMAMAERWKAARFNRDGNTLVNHYTYVICSDGDLMEGISHEAGALAGHLKLGKLICLWDDNHITIEGDIEVASSEDVLARFESYGWHVSRVSDGNNLEAIDRAVTEAQSIENRPSLIAVRTEIGYGSPNKHGSHESHGAPLGEEEVKLTKQALGYPSTEPFFVPDEALAFFRQAIGKGAQLQSEWLAKLDKYSQEYPTLAAEWNALLSGALPDGWDENLPEFAVGTEVATRVASGKALNALAPKLPSLLGGSADLAPSNNTEIKGFGDFSASDYSGRNLHFGIREHAMGAALNGMSLHGGLRPYGATFLIFSDYVRPAIRLSALMHQPVVYIFTHDSIGLGEDGPTHQPIEQIAALRAIPNLVVLRPADANETIEAWRIALKRKNGPSTIILSRQNLPVAAKATGPGTAEQGAYVVADASSGNPELILLGSGSEVSLCLEARLLLEAQGIRTRVVSMLSMELFLAQSKEYRETILPSAVRARLAVETAIAQGWERFTGIDGEVISLEHFGASAPYKVLLREFGFTSNNVVAKALELVKK
ncbi:transketolase [Candidatus Chlorohelix sp.]|uniref:transketolase n=1 Tax=Candidatus Chlorohelix sp. TaxID=3139201 RepID=UPI00305CE4C2